VSVWTWAPWDGDAAGLLRAYCWRTWPKRRRMQDAVVAIGSDLQGPERVLEGVRWWFGALVDDLRVFLWPRLASALKSSS